MKRDEASEAFTALKIELMQDKAKVECLLEQMKSVQQEGKLESDSWDWRLSENIEKVKSLLQKMKLMPEEGGGGGQCLQCDWNIP